MKSYKNIFNTAACIAAIIPFFIALIGCSDSKQMKENLEGARRMGQERAIELKADTSLDTLRIESILIDVREREQRLRTKGHNRIADAYIESFLLKLDSVNPALAAELR